LFWNVMVRREVVQATVRAHGHGALGLPTEGHSLVWVLRGAYELGSLRLEVDEGFSLAASGSIAQLRPLTADALLIHTHLIG
jgi:hypothetical protein